MKSENSFSVKSLLPYYRPQRGLLAADLFFSVLGAAVAVFIPLLVRYITSDVVYWEKQPALHMVAVVVAGLAVMLLGLALLLVALKVYNKPFE